MKKIIEKSFLLVFAGLMSTACGGSGKAETFILEEYETIADAPLDPMYVNGLFPAAGNVRVPVFLVEFPDYPADARDTISKQQLERAFNGEAEDTGFESLHSYYQKSSMGKLNIEADIFGWYKTQSYSSEFIDDSQMEGLFTEVFEAYKDQIDFSDYDSDDDGYVDSVYFIYSRPYTSDTNFWAYKSQMANRVYNDKKLFRYVWMSRYFFDPIVQRTNYFGVDAETLIHESGHLMGLADYYDTDYGEVGPVGGLGGPFMMDYGMGDHDPHSKMLLGWIQPTVVDTTKTGKVNIRLKPLQTGDAIMIAPDLKDSLAIFDEYFLIDFFTPEDLNRNVTDYFPRPGVRLYHVDAAFTTISGSGGESFKTFSRSNGTTESKYLELIENGGVSRIQIPDPDNPGFGYTANETSIYYEGDDFGITQWQDYYLLSYDYKDFQMTMKVLKIEGSEYADIQITIRKKANIIGSSDY